MVILLHTLTWEINFLENNNLKTYFMFLIRILCEGVPIFILVNGFLIINKEFSLKKILKKTLNIFILLIIWSVINIISIKYIKCESIKFNEVIKEVLTTSINSQYTGPLWFLQNLIMLYLIFPILKVLHDNNKKIYDYLFWVISIFVIVIPMINNLLVIIESCINKNLYGYFNEFVSKYNPIINGSFIFYLMLGGYLFEIKKIFEKRKNRIITFLIGIASWGISFGIAILISKVTGIMVPSSFNYSSIFMVSIIIGLYAITYKYENRNRFYNKIVLDIGKNTLGIYLVHNILTVIGKCVMKNNNYSENNVLFPIIVFICSYIIVRVIKKIPIVKKSVEI